MSNTSSRGSRGATSKALLGTACAIATLMRATSARQCPDCDAQFWTCSWDCYEQFGYQPICAELISYKTGNAEDVTVFVNQCEAGCYVKAYEEFYAIQGFEPKNKQQPDASCDAAWKTNQALDYQFFSSPDAFKYNKLLPTDGDLPQWLQNELDAIKADSSAPNDLEIPMKLEECKACQPGADISGRAVLLGADGALAPAREIMMPSPPAEVPAIEVPLPTVPISSSSPAPAPGADVTPKPALPTEVVVPGPTSNAAYFSGMAWLAIMILALI